MQTKKHVHRFIELWEDSLARFLKRKDEEMAITYKLIQCLDQVVEDMNEHERLVEELRGLQISAETEEERSQLLGKISGLRQTIYTGNQTLKTCLENDLKFDEFLNNFADDFLTEAMKKI